MTPITGPFTKTKGGGSWRINRFVYRQVKPYNLKLPYEYYYGVTSDATWQQALVYGGSSRGPITMLANGDLNYSLYEAAQNRAVSGAIKRLNSAMGTTASLGVAFAEVGKTTEMVVNRATQLLNAAKALRRFDGRGFLKALDLSWVKFKKLEKGWSRIAKGREIKLKDQESWEEDLRKKKSLSRRQRIRESSNLWLEYSYAWAPTVGDIQSACDILQNGTNTHTSLRESASEDFTYSVKTNVPGPLYRVITETQHTVRVKVKVGATPIVTNQFLFDLNRLGLTNLAEVIYEVIPWSFIANYFVNLDEYAKSFNMNLGMSYSDPFYTVSWIDNTVTTETTYFTGINGEPDKLKSTRQVTQKYMSLKRVVGSLPTVRLGLRYRYSNNFTRAINNIALLAQKGFKRP